MSFNKNLEIVLGVFPGSGGKISKISKGDLGKIVMAESEIPDRIKDFIKKEVINSNSFKVEAKNPGEIPFPNVSYIKTFGFGFTDESAVDCASAGVLYLITYRADVTDIFKKNISIMWSVYAIAKKFNGYIYDLNSKELFTTDYYLKNNLKNGFKDLRIHVLVQKYAYTPGSYRIVSLGMGKFGCPDIEIRDFNTTASIAIERLVYGVCKKLIDLRVSGKMAFPHSMSLKVKYIFDAIGQGNKIGEKQGKEVVKLRLVPGEYESGDSQKNLVRILPPEGVNYEKWCDDVSGKVSGFIIKRNYDVSKELVDRVYKIAQKNLGKFKKYFQNRSKDESFYAKISIKCNNIEELVWLRVVKKDGDVYTGVMQADSVGCPSVTAGTPFRFKDEDIKDWIVVLKDGKVLGNYWKKMEKGKNEQTGTTK